MVFNKLLWALLFVYLVKSEFPKIVWTYWETGDHELMNKMFNENHQLRLEHDGWEVRFLNKTSALSYL